MGKKRTMPDAYILVIGIVVLMIGLTYVIPAGSFDYAEDNKTILADTFHLIESNPAGITDFFACFLRGMQSSSTTIFLVLLIGGAFQILTDTGAVDAVLSFSVNKTQGNYKLIVSVVIIIMSLLGALGVGNNVALAFCPVMIVLCQKLALDPLVAAATMYLSANTGFSASPINAFTILLAQDIAGIRRMSGFMARSVMWLIFTAIIVWWTLRYCKKILKNPSDSYVKAYSREGWKETAETEVTKRLVDLKPSHILNLLLLIGVFAVYAYGGIKYNWGLAELGSAMVGLAIGSGTIGRMNPNQIVKSFVKGAQTMTYSAILIGFASSVNVIMNDAEILHSLIFYVTRPLLSLPASLSVIGTFLITVIMNFFVPSGSGKCYIIMPILAPMADILGFSRQIAISAFQFGDGLANALVPTSGLLMGFLGIAGVPFDKWMKYVLPVTLIMGAASIVFLIVMTGVGWA